MWEVAIEADDYWSWTAPNDYTPNAVSYTCNPGHWLETTTSGAGRTGFNVHPRWNRKMPSHSLFEPQKVNSSMY